MTVLSLAKFLSWVGESGSARNSSRPRETWTAPAALPLACTSVPSRMSRSSVLPLAIFSRASAAVIFGTAALAASIICLTPSAMFYLPGYGKDRRFPDDRFSFSSLPSTTDISFHRSRGNPSAHTRDIDAASVLLWLDHHRGDLRHHGDRRQRPHRLFAVVSADPRRIRMGSRRDRRCVLVRLCGVGGVEPADRPPDGPFRPAQRDGAWGRADGGRIVTGAVDHATLASLPDHRRSGWRRQHLPRLFWPIALSAQLVQPPPRARHW